MSFKASYPVLLLCLALALVQSNANDSPSESYWKSKLGGIAMPEILKASLLQGSKGEMENVDPNIPILQDGPQLRYTFISYAHNEDYNFRDGEVLWFTKENLTMPGYKINWKFVRIEDGTKFLPLHLAKSTAIASNKLQEITNVLSLDPKSNAAKLIKKMLMYCGDKGIKDEIKCCANSLEAMVDFITNSKKGNYTVVSTDPGNGLQMDYVIQKALKINKDDQGNFVCHKMNSPYTVFLCHGIKSTDVYSVTLVRADRMKMNALAVCHKDTSDWYPGHKAFEVTKEKPGGKPICHFLNSDTLLWL